MDLNLGQHRQFLEHPYIFVNILLYNSLSPEFKETYPILTNLLLKYNTNKEIKKTTYSLIDLQAFTDTFEQFLSTKDAMFACEFYSSIIGKMTRNTYGHFKGGTNVDQLAKLECDIVLFYNNYFSGKLDAEIKAIGEKLNGLI